MATIINPVLPGFNPDPSICRRGEEIFIATSTFEWYPGVQIHRSTNLQDWSLVARPLDRASQLDMRGNPDNCGVWAPSLSWHDGLFWLIYTDVKRFDGNYKDAHNYLVTAPEIDGPWSDPIYMNSSGFDPSLFHDEDGRKWFVNMQWDFRGSLPERDPPAGFFGGILLQEYDHKQKKLTGSATKIFTRSGIGMTEAPHLYRRNGYYHLILAEGGTGYEHAVTHARSRNIEGPYELHPDVIVLSTRGNPDAPLQRVGHGQYIELDNGEVWHTFLCSRPLPGTRRSVMGRETGITRCEWRDDWLYHADAGRAPAVEISSSLGVTEADTRVETAGVGDLLKKFGKTVINKLNPQAADSSGTTIPNDLSKSRVDLEIASYTFDSLQLPADFQWLRTPEPERLFTLSDKPGVLRLIGRESIGSWFEQSLVARRQTAWSYSAETTLEFSPTSFQTQAGLVCYYNRTQFYYMSVTVNDEGQRVICLQFCSNWPDGNLQLPLGDGQTIDDHALLRLGVDINKGVGQFRFALGDNDDSTDAKPWELVGPEFDASLLSDEGARGEHGSFTGAFVGMAAQDVSGLATTADFHNFHYINRPN